MFNKLNRYIKYSFFKYFLLITLIVFGIIFIAELMGNLKSNSAEDLDIIQIALLSIYDSPFFLNKALPIIILFSSITLIRNFNSTNELDVIKAGGKSIWSIISAITPEIIGIGIVAILVISPLVSVFGQQKNALLNKNSTSVISLTNNNFWIADTFKNNQTFIKSRNAAIKDDSVILYKPIIFKIMREKLVARIDAKEAVIKNGFIVINNASIKDNSNLLPYTEPKITIPTNLSNKNLQNIVLSPELIKIWDLPKFITNLTTIGLNNEEYKNYLYNLLFTPLIFLAMFILGVGLSLSNNKRGGQITIIVTSIVAGFLVYFLSNIINVFGSIGIMPSFLAILGEVILIMSGGLYLIVHKEGL